MKETVEETTETHLTEINFADAGGMTEICRRYKAVVVALYTNADQAHTAAAKLIAAGVPAEDVSLLVSEGRLQASLERGVCIIPPSEYRGTQRHGAAGGALAGGTAGLLLGAEVILLGVGAVFALPALVGATLIGVALGSALGATFSGADLQLEGTGFRIHLHQGGALLAVYARDTASADCVEALLPVTNPDEVQRHPLLPPSLL